MKKEKHKISYGSLKIKTVLIKIMAITMVKILVIIKMASENNDYFLTLKFYLDLFI
jgi:hypothetical protein